MAHVQSTGAAAKSKIYGSAVTAGNLLICGISTAGNVTQVSDDVNGNWTKAIDEDDNGGNLLFAEIWYFPNTAGGTPTVSFTGGFDNFEHMAIAEYSDMATSTPLDKTASAIDTVDQTDYSSGTTATTAQADELLIGVCGNDSTRTSVPDAGWTERYEGSANSRVLSFCDRIVSATGAYEMSGDWSGGCNWAICIATFKAAAGGGGGITGPLVGPGHLLGSGPLVGGRLLGC